MRAKKKSKRIAWAIRAYCASCKEGWYNRMNYEDIPLIENVRYLRGHDLLVKFDNDEERVVDMSESFEVPAALKYAPLSIFKKFSINSDSVWWGDEDWIVGHDSLYNMSIPIPQFISSQIKLLGVNDNESLL